MTQNTFFKWSFYRGSGGIDPKNKVCDLCLSFPLKSLLNQNHLAKKRLDNERESLACEALYKMGMDSFDIAGDQLPWFFVEEGQENYALTRHNSVVVFDVDATEYPLNDPDALNMLRKHMGLSENKTA